MRDLPRRAAADWHQVDQGTVFLLGLIADGQPLRVGGNPVVVVAADGEASVNDCGFAAGDRQSQNVAVAVE